MSSNPDTIATVNSSVSFPTGTARATAIALIIAFMKDEGITPVEIGNAYYPAGTIGVLVPAQPSTPEIVTDSGTAIAAANANAAQGVSMDDITTFQTTQAEVTEKPELSPSDIAGTSNVVSLSNAELTSKVTELERRFNNLSHAKFDGLY